MDINIILLIGILIITLLLGMPIVFSLGVSALFPLLRMGVPLEIIPGKIIEGMDCFPLLCIPFFIFAGELMGKGKLTQRLLEFATVLVGRIRGGLALANVLASMFFGGMTGSAMADTSALGSVEIPMMVKAGYDKEFSTAVTTASACIGPIIPPSIPVVIYALAVGNISIGALFLAGVIPGILIGISLMIVSYFISVKRNYPKSTEKITLRRFFVSFKNSILSLMLPFIIIGGIISGIFTPTEAAAIAVLYAFIVTVIIYQTVKLSDIPQMLLESGVLTAIVMIIIGTSTIFGWVIAIEQVGKMVEELLLGFTTNPYIFLMISNMFLLILGTFLDMNPAILIFAPLLAPIAMKLGIDPLHYGELFCINLTVGLITPPLGEILFVACPIGNVVFEDLCKEILPFLLIEIAALLLVTYLPFTTLYIPKLFGIG
ncbi:TRAP transporter large permease [Candidatus Aerophobetes bacterium]|nr:TRAP transporter large permease [Candidatus Aerophobetes bacterium]